MFLDGNTSHSLFFMIKITIWYRRGKIRSSLRFKFRKQLFFVVMLVVLNAQQKYCHSAFLTVAGLLDVHLNTLQSYSKTIASAMKDFPIFYFTTLVMILTKSSATKIFVKRTIYILKAHDLYLILERITKNIRGAITTSFCGRQKQ